MKIQSLISVLVLTCAIVLLASEKKSVLTGQIQDEAGFGVTSGSLEIYTDDSRHQLVHTAAIDENGCYQLANLPAGEYAVVVKSQGYEDKTQKIKIEDSANNLETISLGKDLISLDEAVIYWKAPSNDNVVLLETAVIYGKASGKSPEIAKN